MRSAIVLRLKQLGIKAQRKNGKPLTKKQLGLLALAHLTVNVQMETLALNNE